jgi:hypothetical protein
MGKDFEEFLEEYDDIVCHGPQFVNITVSVDVAVAHTDRVVDEKEVGIFIPTAVGVYESAVVFQSIGADLHQSAILGTTAGTSIEPDDSSLSIGNVSILEVPEEEVSIVLGRNLDMPAHSDSRVSITIEISRLGMEGLPSNIPCVHVHGLGMAREARKVVDIVIAGGLLGHSNGRLPCTQEEEGWPLSHAGGHPT